MCPLQGDSLINLDFLKKSVQSKQYKQVTLQKSTSETNFHYPACYLEHGQLLGNYAIPFLILTLFGLATNFCRFWFYTGSCSWCGHFDVSYPWS